MMIRKNESSEMQVEFLDFDGFDDKDISAILTENGREYGQVIIGKEDGKTYGYIMFNDKDEGTVIKARLFFGEKEPSLVYPKDGITHVIMSRVSPPLACFAYLHEVPGGDRE